MTTLVRHFLLILVFSVLGNLSICEASNDKAFTKNPWIGTWTAYLDGCGFIALNIYDQNAGGAPSSTEIWWLFGKAGLASRGHVGENIRIENEILYVDLREPTATVTPGIAFQMTDQGTLRIVPYGIFRSPLDEFYGKLEFTKYDRDAWHTITDYRKENGEYEKWYDGGSLKPLPENWPSSITTPLIPIFGYDDHLLYRILILPSTPPEMLEKVYNWSRQKAKWHNGSDFPLSYIARNPSCPNRLLVKLWDDPDDPQIWIAAAYNPNANSEWKTNLVDRITSGSARVIERSTWDSNAPVEFYTELIAKCPEARSKIAAKRDLPVALYELLAGNYGQNDHVNCALAANPSVPEVILSSLAKSSNRDVWYCLIANAKLRQELRMQLVHRLIETGTPQEIEELLKEPECPVEYLEKYADDLDPSIRTRVACNPSCPREALLKLVNDPSGYAASVARHRLRSSFPDDYRRISATLVPETSLDYNITLDTMLRKAVQDDDLPEIERLIEYFRTKDMVGMIWSTTRPLLETSQTRIMDIYIREKFGSYNDESFRHTLASLAGESAYDPQWLAYFKAQKAFEGEGLRIATQSALESRNVENLTALIKLGADVNTETSSGQTLLHTAVIRTDLRCIEALIDAGANIHARDRSNLTPLDYALAMKFISAVKLMDKDGTAQASIASFLDEFPSNPNSVFFGAWTNGKNEFGTLIASFGSDGMGALYTAVGLGIRIAWREESKTEATVYLFNEKGVPDREKKFSFKYSTDDAGPLLQMDNGGEVVIMRRVKM